MAREERRLHVDGLDHAILPDPPQVSPLPVADGAHRRLSPAQSLAGAAIALSLAAALALAVWAPGPAAAAADEGSERPAWLDEQMLLSPDYTFGSFVIGPGNRLAHAAAQAVAQKPPTAAPTVSAAPGGIDTLFSAGAATTGPLKPKVNSPPKVLRTGIQETLLTGLTPLQQYAGRGVRRTLLGVG